MTTKIQKYEEAILEEIKNNKERASLLSKEDALYAQYNKKCAEKINNFLLGIGSKKSYDPSKNSCIEYFIVDNLEEGSEEQSKVIEFCEKNIENFESGIDIPKSLFLSSYKVFAKLNIPLNLTRNDFSFDETFEMYKEHVYSATHDND